MNQPSIEQSPLFTRWRDPVSDVESLILTQRVAPIQQSFYFTNSSISGDGRFLWFYCSFPPGGDAYYGRQLGVIDFSEQTVRHFPETQFMDASPFVDKSTGEVYWSTGLEIRKRGPLPADKASRAGVFPVELANNRRPLRIATHLSLSADRKAFAIDALIGANCYIGDLPIDGTTPFRLWQTYDHYYNHALFSPTNPDLILMASDGWFDPSTGKRGQATDRMWLLERGQKERPACPKDPLSSDWRGHEWWDADGVHIWYIDYKKGTSKVNILTGEYELVWPSGHTHSHCDREGQYLVGDIMPIPDKFRIAFFNRKTGREIDIVTDLPPLSYPRSAYHVHPHPQFCLDDRYICYTTDALGTVDLALVSVDQLIERTS